MSILSNFFSSFKKDSPNIIHTPRGDLNLAKKDDRKVLQRMVIELHRTTDALTKKDIADWRAAWQMALNVDSPSRMRLRDTMADLHLSGCIEQRRGFVMSRSFKFVNENGDAVKEALHYFDQDWFKRLLRLAHDSIFYGHSLIELGDITSDGDGCISYDGVRLIPRKHVIPEYHRCVVNAGDDWHSGIDYHDAPYSDWLIEAGQPEDLGLLLKAAPQTISKKYALAFWDGFAEIFGMPMRVARTTTRDPKEWKRLEDMMRNSGANLSMVASSETEIQFVESGKGDAYNVYNMRVDRANSELSKLIIGQTMTIEDGSSLSQSQTHLRVFENLVEADRDMLRDIVNNRLIPRMVRHGFPIKGLRFEWDDAVDYTPEQQLAYETMIADRFEVDPSYFADKYGMPVGDRRVAHNDGDTATGDNPAQKNVEPFFD
ncbi:MAG: DUF935 domain-containing protein [Muribaculaceae bacterium]|nr:DUF935 domain-containing protein [Muribaculaceae bacterium]